MATLIETLVVPAKAMGIPVEDLAAMVQRGKAVKYEAGACLFHESTPREWMGIVVNGEVEVVRGLHGKRTVLAVLSHGAVISEGVLLDESAHGASAFARGGDVEVHQIPLDVLKDVRATMPDLYYRVVA